jgi:hypothetical protein
VVKIGKPTQRLSPWAMAISSDENDISDKSKSAKRSWRQNNSEACTGDMIRSMPSGFTLPSNSGQVRGLGAMPTLNWIFIGFPLKSPFGYGLFNPCTGNYSNNKISAAVTTAEYILFGVRVIDYD